MNWMRDRLMLLVSALSLGALLVGGTVLVERMNFRSMFVDLWIYTVLLFLVIVVSGINELKRRRKKLYRVWPLVVGVLGLLLIHLLAVGVLLNVTGREWGMPEGLAATYAEFFIAVVVLERVYTFCTKRPSSQERT